VNFADRGLDALAAASDELSGLDGRFLLPALVLQLSALGLRGVVWRNVLAAAYPDRRVPLASVAGAYFAGMALNAFLPARGGEVVKVALVRGRIPRSGVVTIASTLSVVLVLDAALGVLLVGVLWGLGLAPLLGFPATGRMIVGAVAVSVVVGLVAYRLRNMGFVARIAQGAAILRTPSRYLRTVLPFQLAAWTCRIGVAFSVLYAFHIHAGVAGAALVVVFTGLSSVVPVPGGVGTQQLLAAYALRGIAPLAGAVTFSVGMQVGVTVINTIVGGTALLLMLRTFRPVAALRTGIGLSRTAL
jgi:uncharacterized membrane protein YbhN (UPF0104 family)